MRNHLRPALAMAVLSIIFMITQATPAGAHTASRQMPDITVAHNVAVYVSAVSASPLVFEVEQGRDQCMYAIPNDGTVRRFPLQYGDGVYNLSIAERMGCGKYRILEKVRTKVTGTDSITPYTLSKGYVRYRNSDSFVKAAARLREGAGMKDSLYAGRVQRYLCSRLTYKKDTGMRMWDDSTIPSPEEIFTDGKASCFGYSELFAAMLRCQGIPCRVVFGTYTPSGQYHAWNEAWIGGRWIRFDVTAYDYGESMEQVADGENYETDNCF